MIIKHTKITANSYWFGEFDGNFSLEQLNENIVYPLQDMVEQYYDTIRVFFRPWIKDNNQLEVDCNVADMEPFTIYAKIDSRKIKSTKDLEKLVPELFLQFDDKYNEYLSEEEG